MVETIDLGPYRVLPDLLKVACQRYGDHPAFSNLGKTISFRELDRLSRDFAAYLQSHSGLQPGDRIAIQLPNLIQFPIAVFGALRAGLVVVNTNPLYTEHEMLHQFRDSGAKALLILANMAHQAEGIIDKTEIHTLIVTQLGDAHPPARRLMINALVRHVKRMVPAYHIPGAIEFVQVMKEGGGLPFTPVHQEPEDIALLQYTGGTTGVSKGAILSHQNIIANMLQVKALLGGSIQDGHEIVIAPLPLYHIYSFTINCMMMTAFGNHTVLITNPRDIPAFVRELRRWRFTLFSGLNSLFVALCANPGFRALDFSALRITISGGMALTTAVAHEWEAVTGCPIIEGYGLTETSPVISVNPPGAIRLGTIGPPLKGTEISIRDSDGQSVPVGGVGELCVKGPQVMTAYWQQPEETTLVFNEEGWLRTGDLAQVDEAGYLKIVDRKKDMIIVSGFNVYPNELEEVISSHPDIAECVVVGLPDEKSGELIKLYAVSRNPHLSIEAVRDYCRQRLTAYKVPQQVEFRDELPKSNVGKVLRRVLKEEELQRHNHHRHGHEQHG